MYRIPFPRDEVRSARQVWYNTLVHTIYSTHSYVHISHSHESECLFGLGSDLVGTGHNRYPNQIP